MRKVDERVRLVIGFAMKVLSGHETDTECRENAFEI